MIIKNLDYTKFIFIVLIILFIFNFNKKSSNEHLTYKKNYKILMKNIQNQESIIQKLDKINKTNKTNKNETKQVYVTESLDGSKELTPPKKTNKKSNKQIKQSNSNISFLPTQPTIPFLPNQPTQPNIPFLPNQPNQPMTDPVYIRDNQVLNDKLYPPLGRTERPQFDLLMNFMNNQPGVFNMYTRGPPDTFRMLGYLTPVHGAQTIDSTLILYGRAKWQNSDIGDFYATSSSKISDIKIPLTQYNCNIKRIWDIPEIVEISGSMLAGKYNFTELPKPDLTHPYI